MELLAMASFGVAMEWIISLLRANGSICAEK